MKNILNILLETNLIYVGNNFLKQRKQEKIHTQKYQGRSHANGGPGFPLNNFFQGDSDKVVSRYSIIWDGYRFCVSNSMKLVAFLQSH